MTASKTTPATEPAETVATEPAEQIGQAQGRIDELKREQAGLDGVYQAAIEQGNPAAMGQARRRRQEIDDEVLTLERALLVAKVDLAAVAVEQGRASMEAAYTTLQAAAQAEQSGLAAARERRSEEVLAGALGRAQYQEAVDRDGWDATATRRRLTGEAAGTRSALVDLQQALERAEGALEAHRQRCRLGPDVATPAPEDRRLAVLGPGGGAPAPDAAGPRRLTAIGLPGEAADRATEEALALDLLRARRPAGQSSGALGF
jgi:hypothetical protein